MNMRYVKGVVEEVEIEQRLLTNAQQRPYLRDENPKYKVEPTGLGFHYTGNTNRGSHALATGRYFNNLTVNDRGQKVYASTHYGVDSERIVQYVPDDEVVWAMGDAPDGTQTRRHELHNARRPNYAGLIQIELHVNVDGDYASAYCNFVRLARYLCKKYNWPIEQIFRHVEITGKKCPLMFLPLSYKGVKGDWNFELLLHHIEHGYPVIKVVKIEKVITVEVEKPVDPSVPGPSAPVKKTRPSLFGQFFRRFLRG